MKTKTTHKSVIRPFFGDRCKKRHGAGLRNKWTGNWQLPNGRYISPDYLIKNKNKFDWLVIDHNEIEDTDPSCDLEGKTHWPALDGKTLSYNFIH